MEALRQIIGHSSDISSTYDIQETLGRGKYGEVKRGVHKATGKQVAVKIVNKRELSLKD